MAMKATPPKRGRPPGLKPKAEKCLQCRELGSRRGLCGKHYQAARRSIQRGEAESWDELISLGLALEDRQGQGPQPNSLREKLKAAKAKK
jgi:hypothetical protein